MNSKRVWLIGLGFVVCVIAIAIDSQEIGISVICLVSVVGSVLPFMLSYKGTKEYQGGREQ